MSTTTKRYVKLARLTAALNWLNLSCSEQPHRQAKLKALVRRVRAELRNLPELTETTKP